MADAFIELQAQDTARDLAHAEWLALLLDSEAASRSTRRFQTRLRAARLRDSQASIEDVDYAVPDRVVQIGQRPIGHALGQRPAHVGRPRPLQEIDDRRCPRSTGST
jgi:hypothetical protein